MVVRKNKVTHAGTANTWRENTGATDEPDGLCGPPVGHPDDHGKGHEKGQGKRHKKQHKEHRPDPCGCTLPWRS